MAVTFSHPIVAGCYALVGAIPTHWLPEPDAHQRLGPCRGDARKPSSAPTHLDGLQPRVYRRVMEMTREQLLGRIWIDPARCAGKPCIRGHRIWVSLILDLLASGESIDDILTNYPGAH